MIIASMCTIPVRKNAFKQVVQRIIHQQTLPVDRLHVWLNGYQDVEEDLLQDTRLVYHLEPSNPGPWVRYKVAHSLSDGDFLITLDDDLVYPDNYVETGIKTLDGLPNNTVLSYGGIIWDPLVDSFSYSNAHQLFTVDHVLSSDVKLALPMGNTCFYPAQAIVSVLDNYHEIFNMNDDMLVGHHLQKTSCQIVTAPRPNNWIKQMDIGYAAHALFRQDRNNRKRVFHHLVYQLGFDPTAGLLQAMLEKTERVLVVAGICPPLHDSGPLENQLRKLSETCAGVHLLSWTGTANANQVIQHVNIPYHIHAVQALDPGGRLDNITAVRRWREWRIRRDVEEKIRSRFESIVEKLKPTEIFIFENGTLIHLQDNGDGFFSTLKHLSPLWDSRLDHLRKIHR